MRDDADPAAARKPVVVGDYYAARDDKQRFLRTIFDKTARHYDGIERWGSFGTGAKYRREALLRHGLRPGMRAIDVGSGTGQVAREIVGILGSHDDLVCVEPSAGMIGELGKTVKSEIHRSTAERLPVPDASFDFLTMGFALRHVDDLEATFREFRRVLKPGGKALIMEVTLPQSAAGRAMLRLYLKHLLPTGALVVSRSRDAGRLMRYYWDSIEQMIPREEVAVILRGAGFACAEHKTLFGCFSEYTATR